MNGKLHLSLGTFVGIAGAILIENDLNMAVPFAIGTMIGSLFPDIDQPSSTISKPIPIIPKLLNKVFGHRGFIHSPLFVFLLYILLSRYDSNIMIHKLVIGFTLGMIIHLVQDFFTKGGIPLFFPFTRQKISFGFFKSGSKADPIITFILGLIWIIVIWVI